MFRSLLKFTVTAAPHLLLIQVSRGLCLASPLHEGNVKVQTEKGREFFKCSLIFKSISTLLSPLPVYLHFLHTDSESNDRKMNQSGNFFALPRKQRLLHSASTVTSKTPAISPCYLSFGDRFIHIGTHGLPVQSRCPSKQSKRNSDIINSMSFFSASVS